MTSAAQTWFARSITASCNRYGTILCPGARIVVRGFSPAPRSQSDASAAKPAAWRAAYRAELAGPGRASSEPPCSKIPLRNQRPDLRLQRRVNPPTRPFRHAVLRLSQRSSSHHNYPPVRIPPFTSRRMQPRRRARRCVCPAWVENVRPIGTPERSHFDTHDVP